MESDIKMRFVKSWEIPAIRPAMDRINVQRV
jgi:hypothetical protein